MLFDLITLVPQAWFDCTIQLDWYCPHLLNLRQLVLLIKAANWSHTCELNNNSKPHPLLSQTIPTVVSISRNKHCNYTQINNRNHTNISGVNWWKMIINNVLQQQWAIWKICYLWTIWDPYFHPLNIR